MSETLVRIPGATAHHVLGQSSVTLGAGELNLVPAPTGSKHDLMLTVGSAGFSLHHDTMVGTLADDSRAYVFSPEIEGVKGGLVKITLPEGVEEDNSPLSALQTKFEQALIAHGLLQPGRSGPGHEEGTGDHHTTQLVEDAISLRTWKPLVTIPRCIAAQVLGEEIAILSEGTLSVDVVPKSEREEESVLTLTVGNSAFLLYKNAAFGTLANDPRTYIFNPVSEGANEGFVAIVLPESDIAHGASSDLTPLQHKLELVLIEHGLLKDGFGAAADEVSRSLREDSTLIAQRIRDLRLQSASAELSNVANSVSRGAEKGMQSLANVAHEVGGAVLGAAFVAGALVTNALAPEEAEPASSEQLRAPARRATGSTRPVGGAVGETKDAPHDTVGKTAEVDHVKEAQDAKSKAERETAVPGPTNVATGVRGGSSFATGVICPSSKQNEGPKAEEVVDGPGNNRIEDDKDVVDTGML